MDAIESAVQSAFETETQQVVDNKPDTDQKNDTTGADTPDVKDNPPADTPAGDDKGDDTKGTDTPDDNPPADDDKVSAPLQLKGDFAQSHWGALDKETKDEFIRLATENERNFKRAAEAEYNARNFRKTLQTVQGYITEVATADNIPEADVIRNCVNIVQQLNDNPTLTARQMINARMIQFDDPVAVINEIARTYGLDLKGELHERNIPDGMQAAAAQAKYDARQAKYVKQDTSDSERDAAINEYINNSPNIKAIVESPEYSDKFVRQLQMERAADPNATDIVIINRAAELFANVVQPAPAPAPVPPVNVVAQKMAKVVSPKPSNVETMPADKTTDVWTPENVSQKSRQAAVDSVRAAMRSMGLDD